MGAVRQREIITPKSHVLKRLGEEGVQVSPLTSRLVKTVPLGVGVGALKVTEGPL